MNCLQKRCRRALVGIMIAVIGAPIAVGVADSPARADAGIVAEITDSDHPVTFTFDNPCGDKPGTLAVWTHWDLNMDPVVPLDVPPGANQVVWQKPLPLHIKVELTCQGDDQVKLTNDFHIPTSRLSVISVGHEPPEVGTALTGKVLRLSGAGFIKDEVVRIVIRNSAGSAVWSRQVTLKSHDGYFYDGSLIFDAQGVPASKELTATATGLRSGFSLTSPTFSWNAAQASTATPRPSALASSPASSDTPTTATPSGLPATGA